MLFMLVKTICDKVSCHCGGSFIQMITQIIKTKGVLVSCGNCGLSRCFGLIRLATAKSTGRRDVGKVASTAFPRFHKCRGTNCRIACGVRMQLQSEENVSYIDAPQQDPMPISHGWHGPQD